MHALLTIGGHDYRVDLSDPLDISIPLDFEGSQPNAFGISLAHAVPYRAGGFLGSVARGGPVNCFTVTLTPHGNGTHTETVGHILAEPVPVGRELRDSFIASTLVSVDLHSLGSSGETYPAGGDPEDLVITRTALVEALDRMEADLTFFDGLIIRTLPNHEGKLGANYSGQNPAYLTHEAMTWIRTQAVHHLLVDVPSVDREDDDGALSNHHVFWEVEPDSKDLPGKTFTGSTITELIYVEDAIHDGSYLLNLQVPDFLLDAAPSRPRLFATERWNAT